MSYIFDTKQLKILDLATQIYEYKGMQRLIGERHHTALQKLQRITMINALKYTMQLDSFYFANTKLIQMVDYKSSIKNNDDMILMGYRDALVYIFNDYEFIDLLPIEIERIYLEMSLGNNAMIEKIKQQNTSMLHTSTQAYYEQISDHYNALERVLTFIYSFNKEHIFEEDNRKLTHLLLTLLLLKSGFIVVKYHNIEQYIAERADEYLEVMQPDSPFVDFYCFYLEIIHQCYEQFFNQFELINMNKYDPYYRVLEVINQSFTPLSRTDIELKLADISRKTIERALVSLQKDDEIKKVGIGKSTKYTLNTMFHVKGKSK
ncbi:MULTISPECIES: Fic family protein [Macrococcus]|uniref:Fido domain-containing protein n=1 Tax=Macrococcus psychrotolerans TaxID=3039389 RepID=A0AAU6RCT9_9STAP|nr:hypothetical protein [Macrococcus sp. S115]MDJ1111860.1 hypothetical protein [Macrococcus sp. S115]